MKNEKNEWGPIWTHFGRLILVTIHQQCMNKSLTWAQKKLFQNALTVHKFFTVKKKKHKSLEILFDRDIKRPVFLSLWVEKIEIVAYDWIILELKERAKTC